VNNQNIFSLKEIFMVVVQTRACWAGSANTTSVPYPLLSALVSSYWTTVESLTRPDPSSSDPLSRSVDEAPQFHIASNGSFKGPPFNLSMIVSFAFLQYTKLLTIIQFRWAPTHESILTYKIPKNLNIFCTKAHGFICCSSCSKISCVLVMTHQM